MNENENKYLSLKTAAGLYGYTRDHLGLMIRQGKLKGIKLGSYYVTTRNWMMDYLKNYADPSHPAAAGKFSNKFLIQAFAAKDPAVAGRGGGKEEKSKIPQANDQNKLEYNFFRDIQKELLPSLKELSMPQKKISAPYSQLALHHDDNALSGSYIILPIRKMEESERKHILRKISECDKSKNESETA